MFPEVPTLFLPCLDASAAGHTLYRVATLTRSRDIQREVPLHQVLQRSGEESQGKGLTHGTPQRASFEAGALFLRCAELVRSRQAPASTREVLCQQEHCGGLSGLFSLSASFFPVFTQTVCLLYPTNLSFLVKAEARRIYREKCSRQLLENSYQK